MFLLATASSMTLQHEQAKVTEIRRKLLQIIEAGCTTMIAQSGVCIPCFVSSIFTPRPLQLHIRRCS